MPGRMPGIPGRVPRGVPRCPGRWCWVASGVSGLPVGCWVPDEVPGGVPVWDAVVPAGRPGGVRGLPLGCRVPGWLLGCPLGCQVSGCPVWLWSLPRSSRREPSRWSSRPGTRPPTTCRKVTTAARRRQGSLSRRERPFTPSLSAPSLPNPETVNGSPGSAVYTITPGTGFIPPSGAGPPTISIRGRFDSALA